MMKLLHTCSDALVCARTSRLRLPSRFVGETSFGSVAICLCACTRRRFEHMCCAQTLEACLDSVDVSLSPAACVRPIEAALSLVMACEHGRATA